MCSLQTFTQYTGSGGKMVSFCIVSCVSVTWQHLCLMHPQVVDSVLEGLLINFFPEAYQHKKMVIETEMRLRARYIGNRKERDCEGRK